MRKLNLYCLLSAVLCVFTLSLNAKGPVPTKVTCARDKAAILKAAKPKAIKKKKYKHVGAAKAPLKQEIAPAPAAPIKAEPVKTEVIKPSTPVPSQQTEKAQPEKTKDVSSTPAPVKDASQQAFAPGRPGQTQPVEKKI